MEHRRGAGQHSLVGVELYRGAGQHSLVGVGHRSTLPEGVEHSLEVGEAAAHTGMGVGSTLQEEQRALKYTTHVHVHVHQEQKHNAFVLASKED